jgi:predicted  nucleic acid-binding Zn-ribbon protein
MEHIQKSIDELNKELENLSFQQKYIKSQLIVIEDNIVGIKEQLRTAIENKRLYLLKKDKDCT